MVSHAIKLTSDHFLICHGNENSKLFKVCIVDTAGTVLKYCGALGKMDLLGYPIYSDIDGGGNFLVADHSKQQVLLLNSNLEFKRCLIDHTTTHPKFDTSITETKPTKIIFDEHNGRIFLVENVWKSNSPGARKNQCNDEVTVYTIKT